VGGEDVFDPHVSYAFRERRKNKRTGGEGRTLLCHRDEEKRGGKREESTRAHASSTLYWLLLARAGKKRVETTVRGRHANLSIKRKEERKEEEKERDAVKRGTLNLFT